MISFEFELSRADCIFLQTSKRSTADWAGRNDNGVKVIFPDSEIQFHDGFRHPKPGDYVVNQVCQITDSLLKLMPRQGNLRLVFRLFATCGVC